MTRSEGRIAGTIARGLPCLAILVAMFYLAPARAYCQQSVSIEDATIAGLVSEDVAVTMTNDAPVQGFV
ncbi:MAG: hypothetical protein L0Z55_06105, partial [Planctomycetes bacterium]|nr:hypothetical protein [Planctomycetota bacterium]